MFHLDEGVSSGSDDEDVRMTRPRTRSFVKIDQQSPPKRKIVFPDDDDQSVEWQLIHSPRSPPRNSQELVRPMKTPPRRPTAYPMKPRKKQRTFFIREGFPKFPVLDFACVPRQHANVAVTTG